jgi:hypothetical protein
MHCPDRNSWELKEHQTGDEALLLLLPAETVSIALNSSNDTRPVATAIPNFRLVNHLGDLDQNNKPHKSWQQVKIKILQIRDSLLQLQRNKTDPLPAPALSGAPVPADNPSELRHAFHRSK